MQVFILLLQLLPLPRALGPQLAGPRALDPDNLLCWRVLNNITFYIFSVVLSYTLRSYILAPWT